MNFARASNNIINDRPWIDCNVQKIFEMKIPPSSPAPERFEQMPPPNNFLTLYKIIIVIFIIVGGITLSYGCYQTVGGAFKYRENLDLTGKAAGGDFVCFWSASALARREGPAAVYSSERMHAQEQEAVGKKQKGKWPFSYPPTFLLMVLPLSLLPFMLALGCWVVITLAGYLLVIRITAPHPCTPWLFLAFPGVYLNFYYGQNGFLSGAIMGGGLLLVDRRPFLAGLILGLLSYKPQLGLLVPVALIAGRRWRALVGAAISTGAMVLVAWMAFGTETWIAFGKSLHTASAEYMNDPTLWEKMASVFAGARLAGAGYLPAMVLQVASTMAVIGATYWLWSGEKPAYLRLAGVAIGSLLAVPYAFEYDLAVVGLAFACLGWDDYRNHREKSSIILAYLWVAFYLASFGIINNKFFLPYPWILAIMFLFVVLHANKSVSTPAPYRWFNSAPKG